MDKQELVKTIREKAGIKNDGDEFMAINLPNCIASQINAIIKLRDVPEGMWFDLYALILSVVGNELAWEARK